MPAVCGVGDRRPSSQLRSEAKEMADKQSQHTMTKMKSEAKIKDTDEWLFRDETVSPKSISRLGLARQKTI